MKQGMIALAIVIGVAVATRMMIRDHSARDTQSRSATSQPAQDSEATVNGNPQSAVSSAAQPAPFPPAAASNSFKPRTNRGSRTVPPARGKAQQSPAAGPDQPKLQPIERIALSYVGEDPAAETLWIAAINDPNISAHDRSDLIEDLNEEGFDDPKNITQDDLPLIENRLALIERLAPHSMDDTNAAAFAEAYKDLINMRARLVGQ